MDCKDIFYLEKDENYVVFHTAEKRFLQRTTLSKLTPQLPVSFCRVHRSFIISMDKVERIEHDFLIVKGKQIPIGRTYRDDFRAKVKQV
ncbi:MAG: LytTR family DNA-binding domain-containing protein [Bacteroidota bacterium]